MTENPFAPRQYGQLVKVTERVYLFRNIVNSSIIKQGGKTGHILNLSHGLHRDTPFENVKHFVNIAKTL